VRGAALLVLLLVAGCVDMEPRVGRALGWAPENKARVDAFLAEHGKFGSHYDPKARPCAVFDWDMTSIFDDVGDATFYYQVQKLALALSPDELAAILPEKHTSGESLAAEREETLAAYRTLVTAGLVGLDHPLEARPTGPPLGDAYDTFVYRMLWFYDELDAKDGALVAYPWVVRLYANLTPERVRELMDRVLAYELVDPAKGGRCTTREIAHPEGKLPPIKIRHGIVANVEMKELYSVLRANGFDVWVCTASFQGTVQAIAGRVYDVPADHVVGIRLETRADGSFTDRVVFPITYRQGKVDNIKASLPRLPILTGGDSDTDVEMLTMPSIELRIIMDRKKSPASDIGKLYERARVSDPEHYLIQGRNDFDASGTALGTWNGTTVTR
jgi:phosphoserine phosphatase